MANKSKGKIGSEEAVHTASVYIEITKDGETIAVHPTQVEQHQRLGWSVKE